MNRSVNADGITDGKNLDLDFTPICRRKDACAPSARPKVLGMSFWSLQTAFLLAMASPDHLFKAHSPESVNLYTSQALLSGCTPNATHGCLDDTAYEFAKQVCAPHFCDILRKA